MKSVCGLFFGRKCQSGGSMIDWGEDKLSEWRFYFLNRAEIFSTSHIIINYLPLKMVVGGGFTDTLMREWSGLRSCQSSWISHKFGVNHSPGLKWSRLELADLRMHFETSNLIGVRQDHWILGMLRWIVSHAQNFLQGFFVTFHSPTKRFWHSM